ncbi:MAG: hypothetical protein EAZ08_06840 [Cytophagales bacterium]|nr:MAG: hypothetical protein EAZ08_06840 [Cytophagales bacterium]
MINNESKYVFQTSKGILKLSIIGEVEPNNGRMLYQVSLHIDNQEVTKEYFGSWNYINFYLDRYVPSSSDGKWLYIPKEGDHFLIDTQNLEKIMLPNLYLSALTFIGNYFHKHYLLVLGREEIIQKNLLTKTDKLLKQIDGHLYFSDLKIFGEQSVAITFSNGQTKIVDIETLEYIDQ